MLSKAGGFGYAPIFTTVLMSLYSSAPQHRSVFVLFRPLEQREHSQAGKDSGLICERSAGIS